MFEIKSNETHILHVPRSRELFVHKKIHFFSAFKIKINYLYSVDIFLISLIISLKHSFFFVMDLAILLDCMLLKFG
jgi:hypothetical protein